MKESFVFYRSFYEAISKIKNKELKADIFEAICELGLNNNVIDLEDNIGQIIIDLIRPQIVANNERYEKGLANGILGGRPNEYNQKEIISLIENGYSNKEISEKTGCSLSLVKYYRQKLDNKSITVKNSNVNENDNVNDNVNVNDNDNNVIDYYETNIGTLNAIIIEKLHILEDLHGKQKLKEAIKRSVLSNKRNLKYIEGILNNWNGKTYDEVLQEDEEYQNRKTKTNQTPSCFTEVEKEQISEEEEKELKELLKGFN